MLVDASYKTAVQTALAFGTVQYYKGLEWLMQ